MDLRTGTYVDRLTGHKYTGWQRWQVYIKLLDSSDSNALIMATTFAEFLDDDFDLI